MGQLAGGNIIAATAIHNLAVFVTDQNIVAQDVANSFTDSEQESLLQLSSILIIWLGSLNCAVLKNKLEDKKIQQELFGEV